MQSIYKLLPVMILGSACISDPDPSDSTREVSSSVIVGGGGGGGGCSGFRCDNLDPIESHDLTSGAPCSGGATTPGGGSIAADNGTLELRWGPNCQVNWARFTPHASGISYYLWVGRQSPGFNVQGFQFTSTANAQYYSNQVYAPGPARACILQWNGSSWVNSVCTPWI
jgi:hypothetical protein